MNRIVRFISVLILGSVLSTVSQTYEHTATPSINGNSSIYTSEFAVQDDNLQYKVYTSSCSFNGLPGGAYPANFKLYFTPYASSTAAGNQVYCSPGGYGSNSVGKIGFSSISGNYSNNYGGRGNKYKLRVENNSSYKVYASFSWDL